VLGRRGPNEACPDDVKFEWSGDVIATEAGCAAVFGMLIQYAEFGRYWSRSAIVSFQLCCIHCSLGFLMSFGRVQRVEVLLYSSHGERR